MSIDVERPRPMLLSYGFKGFAALSTALDARSREVRPLGSGASSLRGGGAPAGSGVPSR